MNDIENTTILKLGNQKWSIRKIAKEVGRSTSYVSSILQRAGKYNFQDKIISTNINNLEDFENNEYIAICKKTGKEFEDFKNKSGIITTHLKQIFPEIIIPTGFKRRMYYTQYKKFWYYDYFDFNVKIHNSTPIKKCPYCEWSTKDLSNKSLLKKTKDKFLWIDLTSFKDKLKTIGFIITEKKTTSGPTEYMFSFKGIDILTKELC